MSILVSKFLCLGTFIMSSQNCLIILYFLLNQIIYLFKIQFRYVILNFPGSNTLWAVFKSGQNDVVNNVIRGSIIEKLILKLSYCKTCKKRLFQFWAVKTQHLIPLTKDKIIGRKKITLRREKTFWRYYQTSFIKSSFCSMSCFKQRLNCVGWILLQYLLRQVLQ